MKFFQDYWPMIVLALWFAYKWWNTQHVKKQLPQLLRENASLIDVRSAAEFASGNAPGSVNIPLNELSRRLAEIPKSSPVVLACASGSRSGMAKLILKKNGYKHVHNVGNWRHLMV